jgi:long-chain acyl-CoA synthetase
MLKVRGDLPNLQKIFVLNPPEGDLPDGVFPASELLAHGEADLGQLAADTSPDDIATLIYTSGTTGPPKGVMLTHRNVCWTIESLRLSMEWDYAELLGKRVVSYLPMAHIAERMTSHYMCVAGGYEVTCCPEPTQIADYAREVSPNLMFGVPRVWEKVYAAVQAALSADPEKGRQFADAIATAKPIAMRMAWGEESEEDKATYQFLDEVAFKGVRQLIGLDECELAISGAAPIPAEVLEWFRAIGVPMTEIYGMSESSGPMTFAARRIKPGTVGPAIPGCEVKLADDGEIICRGGNVFAGYFKEPEKTAEALDEDGWLHSGDIGEIDEDGYFTIVDRKKELIITAGGKNISPANLEAALKTIPLVGQAAAIGDKRPFVAALVTLDPDVAPVWASQHDIEFDSLHELARDPAVIDEIERGLKDVMAQFNQAERVKKVTILGEEWLPDSDVLTPTSKLKRRGILTRYNDAIEEIYA